MSETDPVAREKIRQLTKRVENLELVISHLLYDNTLWTKPDEVARNFINENAGRIRRKRNKE